MTDTAPAIATNDRPIGQSVPLGQWARLSPLAKRTLATIDNLAAAGSGEVVRLDAELAARIIGSLGELLDGLGELRDAKLIEHHIIVGPNDVTLLVSNRRVRQRLRDELARRAFQTRFGTASRRARDEDAMPETIDECVPPLVKLGPGGDYVREIGGAA